MSSTPQYNSKATEESDNESETTDNEIGREKTTSLPDVCYDMDYCC